MATSNKFTETTLVLIHEHKRRRHRVVYLCRFVGAFSKSGNLSKKISRKMAMMGLMLDDALKQKLRYHNENKHALIMKLDKSLLVLDQEHENISLDDLRNKIPENEPRIIAYPYDYHGPTGTKTFYIPLIFVNPEPSPGGCNPRTLMEYASSLDFVKDAMLHSLSLGINNKNDLTEQWLKKQLSGQV